MSDFELALVVAGCLLLTAIHEGSETGMYSLSRSRLDLEAREGSLGARIVRWLLRGEAGLLTSLLIGNTLVLQVMTVAVENHLTAAGVGDRRRELALAFLLGPLLFFFGEVLPKDLFRRRPHRLMRRVAPVLVVVRIAFFPLTLLLRTFTAMLERMLRLAPEQVSLEGWHAHLERLIDEGRRGGALDSYAEGLARNAAQLRTIPVERAMVPWSAVELLRSGDDEARLRAAVESAEHTRLPVLGEGGRVETYLHQLDALAAGAEAPVLDRARPLPCFAPDTTVDRALARLRNAGQRMAVVGDPGAPVGLVTLKDLVEEISGELASW
jgi:CBS domain containing-hemolysin-like protein